MADLQDYSGRVAATFVPRLRVMTTRPGSGMDLLLDKLGEDPEFQLRVRIVVAVMDGVDVGWGALCPPWWTHGLMIHVLEPHGRRGVGTAIAEALLGHAEEPPAVFRGTECAGLFWARFGARVR